MKLDESASAYINIIEKEGHWSPKLLIEREHCSIFHSTYGSQNNYSLFATTLRYLICCIHCLITSSFKFFERGFFLQFIQINHIIFIFYPYHI